MMPQWSPGPHEESGAAGFEAYSDLLWNCPVPLRFEAMGPVGPDFGLTWRLSSWGPMWLHRADTRAGVPLRCLRSPTAINRASPEAYLLYLQLEGGVVLEQPRQGHAVSAGEMALIDTTRPFCEVNHAGDDLRQLFVMFPHEALGVDPDQVAARLVGRPLPTEHGVGPLLMPLLRAMDEHGDGPCPPTAERAAGNVLDLLSVFLAELLDSPTARDASEPGSLLLRAKAHIRRNLADPELTPGRVAAAHHLSLRHLQKVFADHGLTPSDFIRRERLEQCRRRLETPTWADASITDIAFQAGFRDAAHFSRAFRTAYGTSPRDHRARAF
ncbi:helix-turn-helix domain-containing protein [Thermomonospora umbrina]|uniref:AraC family transcriptional regulator n=1 Tax=Thermomonospora umbrina TaxID=111806 RepID=A0A3D9STR9_9ACTN|nr:helix-turn-helix domain-containing protein [Thermomonospora umbrina]REE95964.1 AraC family transcriptional regulator [Thermomonospora umbrina]